MGHMELAQPQPSNSGPPRIPDMRCSQWCCARNVREEFSRSDPGHAMENSVHIRLFGAYGEQVTHPGDLEPALRRALDSGKPAVLDVLIDKETLAPVVFKG